MAVNVHCDLNILTLSLDSRSTNGADRTSHRRRRVEALPRVSSTLPSAGVPARHCVLGARLRSEPALRILFPGSGSETCCDIREKPGPVHSQRTPPRLVLDHIGSARVQRTGAPYSSVRFIKISSAAENDGISGPFPLCFPPALHKMKKRARVWELLDVRASARGRYCSLDLISYLAPTAR